ncbi:MAG TPA: hypothetical protein VFY14_18185 [Streptomyces sp.]|nr:hypothetical protein [Streptomyces sp.]
MRISARHAGTAAVLTAVLLVSGCGSGEDDGGSDRAGSGPSAGESPGSTAQDGTDGGKSADGGVDGTWSTKENADALVLSINGNQAALLGETVCSGPVDTDADPVALTLTCTDKSTERTEGTVESVDGDSLTVAWESGAKDTFTRVRVPTGLPGDLGDLPTDLGELPTDLGDLVAE